MSSMPMMRLRPVQGSGWRVDGAPLGHVPQPFVMAIQSTEARVWSGIVVDGGHEFEGRSIEVRSHSGVDPSELEVSVSPSEVGIGATTGSAVLNDLQGNENFVAARLLHRRASS